MTQTDEIRQVQEAARSIRQNTGHVIVGKEGVTDLLMVALLCEGHVLFEDVPGIGKTTMAKALAKSLGCSFQRIQFTPDLLPSDITGITFYNQKKGEFEFRPGPLLTQVVLADEINRATPRTQSALLEAMDERQISVERETIMLPRPFIVIATQNPVELEGTFPLPEAQLDRFLMRVHLDYPSQSEERLILQRFKEEQPLQDLSPVISAERLQILQKLIRRIRVDPSVERYIVELVRATRNHSAVELGVSRLLVPVRIATTDTWASSCLRQLTYQRQFSEQRVLVGEQVTLSLSVENAKLLPLPWLEIEDTVPRAFPMTGSRRVSIIGDN